MVAEDIVEKIVYRRRGGYCYEVNALFAMALQALGFKYQLLAVGRLQQQQTLLAEWLG